MPWITQQINFSEKQKTELGAICNNSGFIDGLQAIGNKYKAFSTEEKRHSFKEAQEVIKSVQEKAADLRAILTTIHSHDDGLHSLLSRDSHGYELTTRLEKDLNALERNAILTLRDLNSPEQKKAFRRRTGEKLHLALEIESLLSQFGIKATVDVNGAWCNALKIILESSNDALEEPLNIIRQLRKLKQV